MRNTVEQRRLLAVLVADIVGYSRLMSQDEADTFYRLKDFQASLIAPAVERNRGAIVKWTGDGFLGTFESAVDAVRTAVEIQSGAAAAGAGADDDRRIRFRIGINVGDVITVPGDVYGDTVNIAARLQAAAPPDGICIARGVRDTVRGKFAVEFENRGELAVKNIPDPVGAFDVVFDPIAWTIGRDADPTPPTGRRRTAIGIGAAALLAAAIVAGWFVWRDRPPAPTVEPSATASLAATLAARMAVAIPGLDARMREQRAREYEAAAPHKAQAASPDAPGTWRSSNRQSAEEAETAALEECQVFFGRPCVLLARDDMAGPVPTGGSWPRRDMPRARYAGNFDPTQIPGAAANIRERGDVAGYRAAPVPKAAAYHPAGGRVFTVSGAASQHAAEVEALSRCNDDPSRHGEDGRCFLYAVADRVVLPLRLREALTAASSGSTPAGRGSLRAALAAGLASAVPMLDPTGRERAAQLYEAAHGHKAQAASPGSLGAWGLWRATDRASAVDAEAAALEDCQVVYGEPCVLLAVDEVVRPVPKDGKWPRRDMPRVRYEGYFDPLQIPGIGPETRARVDIAGYRTAPAPKAAALRPHGGRVFTVSGAASQHAAEAEALKACDADLERNADRDRCLLYASADRVVLPRRLREPLTAPGQ